MRRQPPPTTAWEIEAARHQEVVASDFGTDKASRTRHQSSDGARPGILARLSGWTQTVTRTPHPADDATPCPPGAVTAIKRGA